MCLWTNSINKKHMKHMNLQLGESKLLRGKKPKAKKIHQQSSIFNKDKRLKARWLGSYHQHWYGMAGPLANPYILSYKHKVRIINWKHQPFP